MSFIRHTGAIIVAFFSLFSFTACSDEQQDKAVTPPVSEMNSNVDAEQVITTRLEELGLPLEDIHDSEVPGFKEVETPLGIFYISEDGKYFIQGRIFEFNENGEMKDLLASRFAALVEEHSEDMIVFPAKNEKYVVTVFTDITCGYCTKLHHDMKDYNDVGITVRYLAYPRQGYEGPVAETMAQIWCADDRNKAMNDVKAKRAIDGEVTDECRTMVREQYLLGRKMGVSGTPAIVLPNGDLVPGYKPAKALLADLEK